MRDWTRGITEKMRRISKIAKEKTPNLAARRLVIMLLVTVALMPLPAAIGTWNNNQQSTTTNVLRMAPDGAQVVSSKVTPPPTPTPIEEWSYQTLGNVASSPAVADVDGDGQLEAVVGSADKKVYCLSSTGGLEWNYTTGGGIDSSPSVADVDQDGSMEVLVGSDDGKLYCLSRAGRLEWSYATGSGVRSSATIFDVDADGQLEVLVGSFDGKVYCLNRLGGLDWSCTIGQPVGSSPAVADVDGDGQLEVLIGSEGDTVYCLNRTGKIEWDYTTTGAAVRSSPAVVDVDADGQLEVLVGSFDDKVYCLNRTGKVEWSYTTGDWVTSSPTVADVDGDGQLEVLVNSDDYKIYCLNRTGGLEWSYQTIPYSDWAYSSPAVADVDGDGQLEVLVGVLHGELYCLDGTGGCEWIQSTGGEIRSSPAVVDLDGDGRLEVLMGSGDYKFHCVSVVSAPFNPGAYPWPSVGFRADVRHSGVFSDYDGDGLTDTYEVTVGTWWWSSDTDRDTASDYTEFAQSTNPLVDTVAPATISNLAVGSPTGTSVTLTWTAPGDNMNRDDATGYIVKFSKTGQITAVNWDSATTYSQSWKPVENGTSETRVILGLDSDTTYWFAIQAYDETPNCAGVSNSASGRTSDTIPPAAISDMTVIGVMNDSITLSWTAPGDNGATGTATTYMVKYSTAGAIGVANWGSATNCTQSWVPRSGGSAEVQTIPGLVSNTTYWFAIKALDEVSQEGGISNSPSGTTSQAQPQPATTTGTGLATTVALGLGAAGAFFGVVALVLYIKKK